MKIVIQEEPSGCGIACAAMLAGVGYAEMKAKANTSGIFAEDERLWSETGYVRRLLGEFGIVATTGEAPFESWDALPDLALLAIKYRFENGRPYWHWTVFERGAAGSAVLDPAAYLAENRRTDFPSMTPQWFIKIKS